MKEHYTCQLTSTYKKANVMNAEFTIVHQNMHIKSKCND
jgi:hypothetical protein